MQWATVLYTQTANHIVQLDHAGAQVHPIGFGVSLFSRSRVSGRVASAVLGPLVCVHWQSLKQDKTCNGIVHACSKTDRKPVIRYGTSTSVTLSRCFMGRKWSAGHANGSTVSAPCAAWPPSVTLGVAMSPPRWHEGHGVRSAKSLSLGRQTLRINAFQTRILLGVGRLQSRLTSRSTSGGVAPS